jgi:uncharacterized membrane protein (UPF0127 family)
VVVFRRLVAVLVVVATLGGLAVGLGIVDLDGSDRATVVLYGADGPRAAVDVRVADSYLERYRGLSGSDPLADGEGMLFVHSEEGEYAYVMRGMSYPLDIVFLDANGTVTRVHHAPLPPPETPNRDLRRYSGRGKYVLEVPYGYTNRTGIRAGDRMAVVGR